MPARAGSRPTGPGPGRPRRRPRRTGSGARGRRSRKGRPGPGGAPEEGPEPRRAGALLVQGEEGAVEAVDAPDDEHRRPGDREPGGGELPGGAPEEAERAAEPGHADVEEGAGQPVDSEGGEDEAELVEEIDDDLGAVEAERVELVGRDVEVGPEDGEEKAEDGGVEGGGLTVSGKAEKSVLRGVAESAATICPPPWTNARSRSWARTIGRISFVENPWPRATSRPTCAASIASGAAKWRRWPRSNQRPMPRKTMTPRRPWSQPAPPPCSIL